jgi:hypothetical protein
MDWKHRYVIVFLGLLLAYPFCGLAQGGQASGVTVPSGTEISTLKYSGNDGAVVKLKPAEQVAFLFVYGLKDLESKCGDTFFGGPGRPCSLAELVGGVKDKNGHVFGLNRDPAQDSNYRYTVMIIGKDVVITAVPKSAGLGAFAWVGAPGGMGMGHFYYNPDGADLVKARELGEVGYSGSGFKR